MGRHRQLAGGSFFVGPGFFKPPTQPHERLTSCLESLDHAAGVLFSGGLDSAILCVELLATFPSLSPLYPRRPLVGSQPSLRWSLPGGHQAQGLESLVVSKSRSPMSTAPHWSTTGSNPGSETPDEAVYLPGRNLLLTVKAAVWCRLRGIDTLALGSLGSNPFPDSTPGSFAISKRLLNQAMDGDLKLIRPFDRPEEDRRPAPR